MRRAQLYILALMFFLAPALALGQPANPSGEGGTSITLGTFGASPTAKGATLISGTLTLQPASTSHPGAMSSSDKTKLDAITGTHTGTNTGDQGAGAGLTGTTTLNVIANADASIVVNANDVQVGVLATDAQHGVRGGGTQHSNAVAAGAAGFMTGADKTKLDAITGTHTGTNTGDVTAAAVGASPNANGFTLTNQVLNLEPASNTQPGIVTTGTQTFKGGKTFTDQLTAGSINGSDFFGAKVQGNNTSNPFRCVGVVTDGAGVRACASDNTNTLSNATAGLHSFRNNTVEKSFVDKDGQFENVIAGKGIVLKSADGTRYLLTVPNGGASITITGL